MKEFLVGTILYLELDHRYEVGEFFREVRHDKYICKCQITDLSYNGSETMYLVSILDETPISPKDFWASYKEISSHIVRR